MIKKKSSNNDYFLISGYTKKYPFGVGRKDKNRTFEKKNYNFG